MEELCLGRVLSQGCCDRSDPLLLASSTERTEGGRAARRSFRTQSGLPTDQQRGPGGTEQLLQGDGQNQGSGRYRDLLATALVTETDHYQQGLTSLATNESVNIGIKTSRRNEYRWIVERIERELERSKDLMLFS